MPHTQNIPEPANGRRVVVDKGPAALPPVVLYWRDDSAALEGWQATERDRWFDHDDSDPISWGEVLSYARGVYLVPEEPMTAATVG